MVESKKRLDVMVVEQGLALTREKAQAMIIAGQILCGDHLLNKPGLKINANSILRMRGKLDHYVSRGAHKLLGAIKEFKVSLKGKVCLDVGASTGGFTQVCLEEGAVRVYALDVGHNQLDYKMRSDARVISMEGVNIRSAERSIIPEAADFACIDTSFISLKMVLEPTKRFLTASADIIALIKPQHEVGRENVGKGGIVRDAFLHELAVREISTYSLSIGLQVLGLIESPIRGTTGNKEFLIHLKV